MGSQESEDPEEVADRFEVRVLDDSGVLIHRFRFRHRKWLEPEVIRMGCLDLGNGRRLLFWEKV